MAFSGELLQTAKLAILIASLTAGIVGYMILFKASEHSASDYSEDANLEPEPVRIKN